jgi:hypothetical protein
MFLALDVWIRVGTQYSIKCAECRSKCCWRGCFKFVFLLWFERLDIDIITEWYMVKLFYERFSKHFQRFFPHSRRCPFQVCATREKKFNEFPIIIFHMTRMRINQFLVRQVNTQINNGVGCWGFLAERITSNCRCCFISVALYFSNVISVGGYSLVGCSLSNVWPLGLCTTWSSAVVPHCVSCGGVQSPELAVVRVSQLRRRGRGSKDPLDVNGYCVDSGIWMSAPAWSQHYKSNILETQMDVK